MVPEMSPKLARSVQSSAIWKENGVSTQFNLDFSKRLPPSAELGMAQADANADERWKREVDAAIREVALVCEFFTVDEIVRELDRNKFHWTTHNQAALGPRMKEVSKTLQYMVGTDQFKRSERPISHGNLLRVWKRQIYQP